MRFYVGSVTGYQPLKGNVGYVVRPTYVAPNVVPGLPGTPVRGIRAEFYGSPPTFDSEEAQLRNGWTDDQRIEVERYLLHHIDFTHGRLYADEIPPEHLEHMDPVLAAPPSVSKVGEPGYCQHVTRTSPHVELCGEVTDGTEFCPRHTRELEEVS